MPEMHECATAAVRPKPAGSVSIVDVDVQPRIGIEQTGKFIERCDVTEHRINPVNDEPDTVVLAGQFPDQLINLIHSTVTNQVNRRVAQQFGGAMQAGMSEMVKEYGIVILNQHR